MARNPVTFREILELLSSDYASRYSLPNYTESAYHVKPTGKRPEAIHPGQEVPLGTSMILETLFNLPRTSRLNIRKFYEGKSEAIPYPDPPFFINLAQLLIMLDEVGTPLTRKGENEPIVFRGGQFEGLKIESWMQLWALYMQDYSHPRFHWSDFVRAFYRKRQGLNFELAEPKTALSERLFVAMCEANCVTSREFALYVVGEESSDLLYVEMIIQKIIDGQPLTLDIDKTSILGLIANNLAEDKSDPLYNKSKILVEMSQIPLQTAPRDIPMDSGLDDDVLDIEHIS
jgi:hypothetical protein